MLELKEGEMKDKLLIESKKSHNRIEEINTDL